MSIQEALDLTGLRTLWAKIKQYITAKLEHKPDVYTSTSEPTSSDGNNGDLWLVYDVPPVLPTFTIHRLASSTEETYNYESGMTLGEWVGSEHNTNGFYNDDGAIMSVDEQPILDATEGLLVSNVDVVDGTHTYNIEDA